MFVFIFKLGIDQQRFRSRSKVLMTLLTLMISLMLIFHGVRTFFSFIYKDFYSIFWLSNYNYNLSKLITWAISKNKFPIKTLKIFKVLKPWAVFGLSKLLSFVSNNLYNILFIDAIPEKSEVSNKDWVFLNYTFKRFEGLTQRGTRSLPLW